MSKKVNIFWFRRDLRLADNAGLYHALKAGLNVQCVFLFDNNILDELPRDDARVTFIYQSLQGINEELLAKGSSLAIFQGEPIHAWQKISESYNINAVYCNEDWEPYALNRDALVAHQLQMKSISFHKFKDHVIFRGDEVTKDNGSPYTVFTPFKKKWLATLDSRKDRLGNSFYLKSYPSETYSNFNISHSSFPLLSEIGFTINDDTLPKAVVAQSIIKQYDKTRDIPAIKGTSHLGIHFRFGTISIRQKARNALILNATFLSELIWREFYSMIMYFFPHVCTSSFRVEYDRIAWRNNKDEFEKWANGQTGYPIVDAGMRELNATGFMHNRVRMITASFLTKHLLIDWRWGESYFAEKLLDFDLASNNGGWQWAAGCGTDAAPYFRIFNPTLQEQRFDKDRIYIRKWVPEVDSPSYPKPMVDHKEARERCLAAYKLALSKS